VELVGKNQSDIRTGLPGAATTPHIRALAALVIGLCMEYWGDTVDEQSGWGRQHILSLIDNRVGLSAFTGAMAALDHRFFTSG